MNALALLVACAPSPTPPPPGAAAPGVTPPCADCHAAQVALHAASHHALADREVRPGRVPLDPQQPGGLPFDRVLGVWPLWQPLLPAPGGRLQVSSLAWDVARGGWFDVFPDPRAPGDWGHWTGRGMTWNAACAPCHDTGVEVGWDPATDTYRTRTRATGVSCEACHDGAAVHAADPTIPTAGPSDDRAWQARCEGCHARWTPIRHATGTELLDRGLPTLNGLDEGFLPDGRVAWESFEATSFRASAHHAAGLGCLTCHDAHTAALRTPGDGGCTSCHTGPHPSHPPGPSCVDCHLPVTVHMQRHRRHDHLFPIPDPGIAATLGLPSPCAPCHDASPAFLARAAAWAPPDEAARDRARAVAAARAGASDAGARLSRALADAPAGARPGLIQALQGTSHTALAASFLADPDPLVRFAAASALADHPADITPAALADPVAAVRLQAARALRTVRSPDDPVMAELRRFLEASADHPALAHELGTWWHVHGQPRAALPHLQRAARLDPQGEAWSALAVALAAAGQAAEALATLDRAVAQRPNDAELHYLRALALAERGGDAEAALERALSLDPNHPRAARALGQLRAARGDDAGAAIQLERALSLAPDDAVAAWSLATVRARQGQRATACSLAERAARLDPGQADAAAFARGCR